MGTRDTAAQELGVGGSSGQPCPGLLLCVPKACDWLEPVVNRAGMGTLLEERERARKRGMGGVSRGCGE